MDKGITYELVRDRFVALRNLKQGYVTNFFIDAATFDLWRRNNDLQLQTLDQSTALLRKNEGFYNLFFATTTPQQLAADLPLLLPRDNQQVVVDLVGREQDLPALKQVLLSKGFVSYCSLVRMSRAIKEQYQPQPGVEYAQQTDAQTINELLHTYFDPLSEQLPLPEQIDQWIVENRILLHKIGGKTAGFLIFEINGITSYLRYWFTHPDYRDQKVGSTLLRHFFYESNATKRQLFWVIEENQNAIEKYHHYGFQKENMFDQVLILRHYCPLKITIV